MKKFYALSMGLLLGTAGAFAQSVKIADFEAGGVEMFNPWGAPTSSASVEDVIGSTTGALNGSVKCAKVNLASWNDYLGFDVTLPVGAKLSDYNQVTMKVYVENFTWKDFSVKAKELNGSVVDLGDVKFKDAKSKWVNLVVSLNAEKTALITSSSFKLIVGANNNAEGYYIDDIELGSNVAVVNDNSGDILLADFDQLGVNTAIPIWSKWGQQDAIFANVQSVISPAAGVGNSSTNACKVMLSNWDQYLGFSLKLPVGKTLADYSSVSFKALVDMESPVGANAADLKYKTYRLYSLIVDPADATKVKDVTIAKSNPGTVEVNKEWTVITIDIDPTLIAGVISDPLMLILGVGAQYGIYWVDDVVLKAKSIPADVYKDVLSRSEVISTPGSISILNSEGASVEIYTMTGVKVAADTNIGSEYSVAVGKGTHVVVVNGVAQKVLVK